MICSYITKWMIYPCFQFQRWAPTSPVAQSLWWTNSPSPLQGNILQVSWLTNETLTENCQEEGHTEFVLLVDCNAWPFCQSYLLHSHNRHMWSVDIVPSLFGYEAFWKHKSVIIKITVRLLNFDATTLFRLISCRFPDSQMKPWQKIAKRKDIQSLCPSHRFVTWPLCQS